VNRVTTGQTTTMTRSTSMTDEDTHRRPLISARVRILGVTMAIVTATSVASVVLLRALLIRDQDRQNDRRLVQEADEFAEVAGAAAVVPGEPADASARRIMEQYLRTNVPDADEAFLTFVSSSPFLASADAPAPLDDVEWAGRSASAEASAFDVIATSAGRARTLSVPLVIGDGVAGVFSVAVWEEPGRERIDRSVRFAALVSGVALLGALALAWTSAGRVLRPLRSLADASRRITESDLSQRIPPAGTDEIGVLVEQYNDMLDRLDRSFATQRAFLDDAGHELRTPLTIARGHAELADSAEGWSTARPFVLAELDRMSRIVDDLLLLAKAEQPDFVNPRPTDVSDLVTNALHRGQALADRVWVDEGAPDIVADVDQQRLEQALLNLVANAIRHTSPSGTIAVGADVDGDVLRLWVGDDGDGIAPADHDKVFRRFQSAAGRGRGGSAGLGLAIAQAIAAAHHGTVELESELGRGARFIIRIPIVALG
jgi:two-component system, OmpR family, sensor kinase